MGETRIGSGAGIGPAEQDEARRRSAEAAGVQASSTDARRQASAPRTAGFPVLPPVSDDVLRAFAENANAKVPPAVADLSLYTDPLLEREIDASRGRLGLRGGADADGERFVLARLEGEMVKRHTPKPVEIGALASLPDVEAVTHAERTFLTRFRVELTPNVRADHERTLGALVQRRESLEADARACDGAQPATAPLRDGVLRLSFTADDLVVSLKQQVNLTPQAEAQVRGTFERWHRDTCRQTGQDPAVVVSQQSYAEARLDRAPAQQAELKMRLEMLDAARTSACAALAFLDSAARGDSVTAAHARVMNASTLSDIALTMPSRPPSMHVESPRAEAREIEGLGRKNADESRGVGHAQNTRFRGVSNAQFERDLDKVTYGPWRKNVEGPRTMEQAKAIFEKQTGQKLPPWVKLVVDPKLPADRHAEYVFDRSAKPEKRFNQGLLEDVVVRVRPDVLESDEAIVGVLRHETYELENLARKLETTSMTNADVRSHTGEKRGQNLHGQAWDVADLEVHIMRETPGSAKHAQLLGRRDAMLARFALQNHGESE